MPSINASILLLALMAVSPLGSNAAPQAQASSAKSTAAASSAAVATSAAAKSSAAAVASSAKPSTTAQVTTTSITPSSAAAKSSVAAVSSAAASAAKSSAAASSVAASAAKSSSSSSAIAAASSKAATSVAPALTSPSGTAINSGSADANALLKLHNDFRAHYGANALTWDNNLAAFAQKASNTCKFAHTGGPNGENLAAGAGGGFNYTSGFGLWAKESSSYNWKAPGFSAQSGHFTQVVWQNTTKVGCGVTQCPDKTIFAGYGTSTFLVCEYQNPGNVIGNNNAFFASNVGTYR